MWPPIIFRPVNQTMFENGVRQAVGWINFVLPEDRVEDIEETLTFMYKPWPLVDDGILNKQHLGKVYLRNAGISYRVY